MHFAYIEHFRLIPLSQPLYFVHNITFFVEQGVSRRKIRLIEGNAKSRHVKNLPVKELVAGVYLSEA
jgi:hypothetical protein